jgi:hypothetical protein
MHADIGLHIAQRCRNERRWARVQTVHVMHDELAPS